MATPAQIQANRLNARKSTGPRSTEGKAAVRFNALKFGLDAESLILPGEDPEQLEQLRREYFDQFQPLGPVETALVETIIRADWVQRRYFRMETEIMRAIIAALEPTECPLGAAFHHDAAGANALQKLFRRQQAAERDWNRARAELRQLQAQRAEAELASLQENFQPPAPSSRPPASGLRSPAPDSQIPAPGGLQTQAPVSFQSAAPGSRPPAPAPNRVCSEPLAWRL